MARARTATVRKPAKRGAKSTVTVGDQGSPILQRVQELVAANASLRSSNAEQRAEIDRLKALLGQIERSLRLTPSPPAAGRVRRSAPTKAGAAPKRRKGKRAVITDPEVLEKRRAALEKARKALAEKRAEAKKAS